MECTSLVFERTQSVEKGICFLREAILRAGLPRPAFYEMRSLIGHLFQRITQTGMAVPYAMCLERNTAESRISMVFALYPDGSSATWGSAVVWVTLVGVMAFINIAVLPGVEPSRCIGNQSEEVPGGTSSPCIRRPQSCIALLPGLLLPLVCKNNDVFAPWLIAGTTYEIDDDSNKNRENKERILARIADYIALALEYDQLQSSSCFAVVPTQRHEEQLILGYAPMEEVGEYEFHTKIKFLVHDDLGWVYRGRMVTCVPLHWSMPIYPRPVAENSVILCARAMDTEIWYTEKTGQWMLVPIRSIIVITDLGVDEILSDGENIQRLHRATRQLRVCEDGG